VGRVLVGTSGFVYAHWKGVLYPPELPPRQWLQEYARTFSTVELNNTFYRLPRADAAERWRVETPPGFLFAAKGSRYLTHMKRLLEPSQGLARFFEPLSRLGHKLVVILWQLPPRWRVNPDRLEQFLVALPPGVRHAFEFREESWYSEEICAILDAHGAAFCEHDLIARPPPRFTGGFRYLRFHGRTGKSQGRYGRETLAAWSSQLTRWSRDGRDVYVYFNNDTGGQAVHDARGLMAQIEDALHPPAAQ